MAEVKQTTKFKDMEIQRSGTQIILPVGMEEKEAIVWLQRFLEQQETVVNSRETIKGYPADAIRCFTLAMKEKYGWSGVVPTPGFFGPRPPTMINVPDGPGDSTVQVPWGNMVIPGIEGTISPTVSVHRGELHLVMVAQIKQKHVGAFKELCENARHIMSTRSLYKGRAIGVDFKFDPEHEEFDPSLHCPRFLDDNFLGKEDLILNPEIDWAVRTLLWAPVEKPDAARKGSCSLKRTALLTGPYGTGKTLLANVTAGLATSNGWTFIYLDKTSDVVSGLRFARMYAPAVVFAEDVDSVLGGQDRSEEVNEILNTLDGIEGKRSDVMLILSTNHPKRLNKALLRQGRIDGVIEFTAPNAGTAERLVRKYGGKFIDPKMDLGEVGQLLNGVIPAAIREVVERAKLASISKQGEVIQLHRQDLIFAAQSIQSHMNLLNQPVEQEPTDLERGAQVLGTFLTKGLTATGKAVS